VLTWEALPPERCACSLAVDQYFQDSWLRVRTWHCTNQHWDNQLLPCLSSFQVYGVAHAFWHEGIVRCVCVCASSMATCFNVNQQCSVVWKRIILWQLFRDQGTINNRNEREVIMPFYCLVCGLAIHGTGPSGLLWACYGTVMPPNVPGRFCVWWQGNWYVPFHYRCYFSCSCDPWWSHKTSRPTKGFVESLLKESWILALAVERLLSAWALQKPYLGLYRNRTIGFPRRPKLAKLKQTLGICYT